MNPSTSGTCPRISSRDWLLYGSSRPSRNRSSPCSVQRIGSAHGAPDGGGEGDEHRVREHDHVEPRLLLQPVHQLAHFLRLEAVLAAQRGDGQLAQKSRVHRGRATGEGPDDGGRVPDLVEDPGGAPQQGDVLLQVDADPAEQHLVAADVGLVGEGRGVDGQQGHVVPARHHLGGERVVAHARPAVHAARPGGDREDPHRIATLLSGRRGGHRGARTGSPRGAGPRRRATSGWARGSGDGRGARRGCGR